jgi:hypothetical protein
MTDTLFGNSQAYLRNFYIGQFYEELFNHSDLYFGFENFNDISHEHLRAFLRMSRA